MVYRSSRSYTRFPETVDTIPEKDISSVNDNLDTFGEVTNNERKLNEQPVIASQNVYSAVEDD